MEMFGTWVVGDDYGCNIHRILIFIAEWHKFRDDPSGLFFAPTPPSNSLGGFVIFLPPFSYLNSTLLHKTDIF